MSAGEKIEAMEERLGRHWSDWTAEEVRAFVPEIGPADLTNPLCLRFVFQHADVATKAALEQLERYRKGITP